MTQGSQISGRRAGIAPGTILNNNYRVVEQLGEGGMGAVYLACNTFLEEDCVAIKVIRTDQAHDDLVRQMFGKEVRAMLRVNNPRIVSYRTFAHDPDLDISFIVTEYIDGPSLETLMKQRRFHPRELCILMTEICIGLRAAHNAGVVHRDLAPDNVLLEDGDISRPKIIDFGIVKDVRQKDTIIGTGFAGKLNFVAPEQLGEPEEPVGPWTDIYSLALVMLGLARGGEIDMGSTPGAAIRKRHEEIDLSALDPLLRPLFAQMLATHPSQRPQSVEEVMAQIEEIVTAATSSPPDAPVLQRNETVMVPSQPAQPLYQPEPDLPEYTDEPEVYDDAEYEDAEYEDEESETGGNSGVWLIILFSILGAAAVIAGVYFGEYSTASDVNASQNG